MYKCISPLKEECKSHFFLYIFLRQGIYKMSKLVAKICAMRARIRKNPGQTDPESVRRFKSVSQQLLTPWYE